MSEDWSRPKGAELDENEAALRRMRIIVVGFAALAAGVLCAVFFFVGFGG